MLGGGRREGRPDLSDELTLRPQAARLIEKIAHLTRHATKPCRRPEDDSVVIGKLIDRGSGRALIQFEPGCPGNVGRHQFGHALHHGLSTGDAHALGLRIRQRLDVAV